MRGKNIHLNRKRNIWKFSEDPNLYCVFYPDDDDAVYLLDNIINALCIPDMVAPVVYTFYEKDMTAMYVGSSFKFYDRLSWHMDREYYDKICYIGLIPCEDRNDMRIAELYNIYKKQPYLNSDGLYDDGKTEIWGLPWQKIEINYNMAEFVFVKENLIEHL